MESSSRLGRLSPEITKSNNGCHSFLSLFRRIGFSVVSVLVECLIAVVIQRGGPGNFNIQAILLVVLLQTLEAPKSENKTKK